MYSMKDVCRETGMTYEALKFYCNEGLIPNVNATPTITVCSMTVTSHGSRV